MKSAHFNQDGHLSKEGISWYVEYLLESESHALAVGGDKTARASQEEASVAQPLIIEHIQQCTECHQQAIELYGILADIPTGIPVETATQSGRKPLPWRFALILLLIPLAYFLWQQQMTQPPAETVPSQTQPPVVNPEGTEQKPVATLDATEETVPDLPEKKAPQNENPSTNLYAANFTPLEHLDAFVAETVRGGKYAVLSPENDAHFVDSQTIIFEWNAGESLPLELILLNNQEETLLQIVPQQQRFQLDRQLDPGLYYWKLETATELLHLGRFWVDQK